MFTKYIYLPKTSSTGPRIRKEYLLIHSCRPFWPITCHRFLNDGGILEQVDRPKIIKIIIVKNPLKLSLWKKIKYAGFCDEISFKSGSQLWKKALDAINPIFHPSAYVLHIFTYLFLSDYSNNHKTQKASLHQQLKLNN